MDSLERRRLIERHITKFNDWKLIRRKVGVLKTCMLKLQMLLEIYILILSLFLSLSPFSFSLYPQSDWPVSKINEELKTPANKKTTFRLSYSILSPIQIGFQLLKISRRPGGCRFSIGYWPDPDVGKRKKLYRRQ